MNEIKRLFYEKINFINNANITDLDKKILLDKYNKYYKNLIYLKKDNEIIPMNTFHKYYSVNSQSKMIQHNNTKYITNIEEVNDNGSITRKKSAYKKLPDGQKIYLK